MQNEVSHRPGRLNSHFRGHHVFEFVEVRLEGVRIDAIRAVDAFGVAVQAVIRSVRINLVVDLDVAAVGYRCFIWNFKSIKLRGVV